VTSSPSEPIADGASQSETRRQMRGSSLLLVGRAISLALNLLVQVLIARYLTKQDFGSFAYALSIVAIVQSVGVLGFDRSISRFLPVYDERGDHPAFFGTLFFVVSLAAALGGLAVLAMTGFQGWISGALVADEQAVLILAILIALGPIEIIDGVMTDLFAVLGAARAIFLRKFIIGPGLRLAVVGLLVLGEQDVTFLAVGYVATGLTGIALYVTAIPGLLRARGLLQGFSLRSLRLPFGELAGYCLPLLTTDLVIVVMAGIDVVVLGALHGTTEVADLRVIESAARTNGFVLASFAILFAPAAARLHARRDRAAMRTMYWQSAAWIAVLSFPIFAATFALAEAVTVTLYGEQYRASGVFLALLALGRYLDVAFGSNGQALRIFASIRTTIAVNLGAAAVHAALAIALIPPLGALGVAVAMLLTYAVYNLAKQVALSRASGVPIFDTSYLSLYAAIIMATAGLALANGLAKPPLPIGIGAVVLASLVVVFVGRRHLQLMETFPELARVPLLRRLL
jgi:O-antigen/teichoic acid export membrane protein